jgi:hypothetical protein
VIDSPSKSISKAFFYEEKDLINATPGVVQNTPHFTPGVENIDLFVAITKSVEATSCKPAAATSPLTTETTGKLRF